MSTHIIKVDKLTVEQAVGLMDALNTAGIEAYYDGDAGGIAVSPPVVPSGPDMTCMHCGLLTLFVKWDDDVDYSYNIYSDRIDGFWEIKRAHFIHENGNGMCCNDGCGAMPKNFGQHIHQKIEYHSDGEARYTNERNELKQAYKNHTGYKFLYHQVQLIKKE